MIDTSYIELRITRPAPTFHVDYTGEPWSREWETAALLVALGFIQRRLSALLVESEPNV